MEFYELDFLQVPSKRSGDAIACRYSVNGIQYVHVVDAGFQNTGQSMVDFIRLRYGTNRVDHVVASHPDGDHAGGIRTVLEEMDVGCLWMWRPWIYTAQLIERFSRFRNRENLAGRLKEAYPNLAALEEIAIRKRIPIFEPVAGAQIGPFIVCAPSKERFLRCVLESDKTPEAKKLREIEESVETLGEFALRMFGLAVNLLDASWGREWFSEEPTSAENEMSVVQFAELCGHRVLLTADAGREGLTETIANLEAFGIALPGIRRFQVPHHGSRRNVSTEILDRLLGLRRSEQPEDGEEEFDAIVCASDQDEFHPRNAVERAMVHRGAKFASTEKANLQYPGGAAPPRHDYHPLPHRPYPTTIEE